MDYIYKKFNFENITVLFINLINFHSDFHFSHPYKTPKVNKLKKMKSWSSINFDFLSFHLLYYFTTEPISSIEKLFALWYDRSYIVVLNFLILTAQLKTRGKFKS